MADRALGGAVGGYALSETFAARARDDTPAAMLWFLGFLGAVLAVVSPLVVRRIECSDRRPLSQRGKHADR